MFCPNCNSLCQRIYTENENGDISNVTYYCDLCWWDEQLVNAFDNLRLNDFFHLSYNEEIDYSDGF